MQSSMCTDISHTPAKTTYFHVLSAVCCSQLDVYFILSVTCEQNSKSAEKVCSCINCSHFITVMDKTFIVTYIILPNLFFKSLLQMKYSENILAFIEI